MKRLPVFALLMSGLAFPAVAQHAAGHAGGGAGHAGGNFAAGRSFSNLSSGPSYANTRVSSFGSGLIGSASTFGSAGYRNGRYRGNSGAAYGGGFGYPGYAFVSPYILGYPDVSGYGDPGLTDQSQNAYPQGPGPGYGPPPGAGYDYPQAPDPRYMAQQQPVPSAQDGAYAPVPQYAPQPQPQAAAPRPPRAPEPVPEEDAVTIVFKDGRSPLHIHNYALTPTMLYVTDQRHRDIPLDQIDLVATQKVNHDEGVDFRVPEAK